MISGPSRSMQESSLYKEDHRDVVVVDKGRAQFRLTGSGSEEVVTSCGKHLNRLPVYIVCS